MEDRDWQSIENAALTNFSSHENKTNEFLWIDLAAGASLPLKYLYIKPFISGSWMSFMFIASGGYYKYAEENPEGSGKFEPIKNAPDKPLSGNVITYRQDWLLLAAGLTIGTNILAPFSFDFSFQISPLTYCAAVDNHIRTNTVYKDFTYYGLFLEPKFSVSFDAARFKFSFDASYRSISKTKGESYAGYNNKNFTLSANKAGAGLSVMDFQFAFKYRFL